MAITVRDLVKQAQQEIRDTDLTPDRARSLLMQMSALIGNVNAEIRVADSEYAAVLLAFLDGDEAANRARIRAECSPEFARKREARDTKELVVEQVRSLKYFLKSLSDEMRMSGAA